MVLPRVCATIGGNEIDTSSATVLSYAELYDPEGTIHAWVVETAQKTYCSVWITKGGLSLFHVEPKAVPLWLAVL